MPSSNAVSPDRLRTPFALSLQRGTTIIRCTPPKAIIEPTTEEQIYSQYYDDVKLRRAPAPPLPGDFRHGGRSRPATHPLRGAPCKDAALQRQRKACGVADMREGTSGADYQLVATVEEHIRVPSRSSSHPVTDSRCSPGREGGRGDEDGVAASSLTESPPSPKVVVDWGQPDPHVDGQESAKGDETRSTSHSTDETVVRGYIGIAYALLRHFEEALGTQQRLTAGSLQCAETVCKALNALQDLNPRFQLLAQRIATAIGLLHRRKELDDKDAAERGVLYGKVEFPYPGVDKASWAAVSQYSSSPLWMHPSNSVEKRAVLPRATGSLQQMQEETMDLWEQPKCCTSVNFQAMQCRERQQRRIAGPPTPKVVPVHETVKDMGTNREVSLQAASSQSCSVGEIERGGTSTKDSAIAFPSGKRVDACLQGKRASLAVSEFQQGTTSRPSTGSLFLQTEQLRKTSEWETCSPERPYSTLQSAGKSTARLPVLCLSNVRTRCPHSSDGLPRTHLVGPHLGGVSSSASNRTIRTAIPFRESEGNLNVRPLVLSETHVLADKGSSQWKEDPNRASAAEALALIRCATDLIVSGEGPGFVEKQFFRYFGPESHQSERPRIPEGMTPAQGKYLLLRYAIARVEAEYGEAPTARETHLYLRDLRRMEQIVVDAAPPQILTISESPCRSEGQDSQLRQSAHFLPERSPEERMERRLPLTILSLPTSAPRQEAGQPRVDSPTVHSEGTNHSSVEQVLVQLAPPKQENSFRSTGSDVFSPQLNTMSLPNPLPILGGSGQSCETLATSKQTTSSSIGELRQPSQGSSSSYVSAVSTPVSALPDVPTAADEWENESKSCTSSREVSLPTPTLARESSSASLAQSTAASGLLALRRDSSSFEKFFEKSPPAEEGNRSKLLIRKGSFDPISVGEKGLKLSSRSVVRDSVSGAVTSVIFEPPKNTAVRSVLDTATSAALNEITEPRASILAPSELHA